MTVLGWILVSWASAAEPVLEGHVVGAIDDSPGAGVGGAFSAGWSHAQLGIALDAGVFGAEVGPAPFGLARPRLHLFPAAPGGSRGHLLLGAGGWFRDAAQPVVEIGGGLDLGEGVIQPRIQASYVTGLDGSGRALLTVGLVRRPSPPEPVPQAEAPVFDAAMVWVPGPVCRWLPPEEAGPAWLEAESAAAARASLIPRPAGHGDHGDGAPPAQGDLVVAAFPGDRVEVDGTSLVVSADGIAWASLSEGRAKVHIEGGGRNHHDTVAVGGLATLWYAAPEPEPRVKVVFAAGSDQLDAAAVEAVEGFAGHLGGWQVEIWGSASPEGDRGANEDLARRRALQVARLLEEAGVDGSQVLVLGPRPPEEGLPPEQQRAAVLNPVRSE